MYRLTREAQANVNEITEFIAEDNVDAAIRVLDALEHAFARIAANPEIGHNRDDLTDRPVAVLFVPDRVRRDERPSHDHCCVAPHAGCRTVVEGPRTLKGTIAASPF